MTNQNLLLKWGTLKGWNVAGNEAAASALDRYFSEPTAYGAAQRNDTQTQKQALCDAIDALDGVIQNDWTGEMMSKDEAKAYILEYRKS